MSLIHACICIPLTQSCQGHTENITEIQDPRELVDLYQRSVALAKKAGFDGVELLAQGFV